MSGSPDPAPPIPASLSPAAPPAHPRAGPGPGHRPVSPQHPSRGRVLHLPACRRRRRCPWNLDCHNCDKFVLSGADLLYWRRKREQWRLLAEGAPDDATADYLHHYFEPTARAIDGLEKALAGLGLLDDALALDLRKPQDYFHRVWSTAFRAADLADIARDTTRRTSTATTCPADGDDPEQDAA